MKVLVVEDDRDQGSWLCEALEEEMKLEPLWIQTESEFRRRLDDIDEAKPDVAVIDIMLRWAYPGPDLELPPPDARGVYSAGLRCAKILRKREATRELPVVIYTVLESKDLEERLGPLANQVTPLQKDADLEPLFAQLREVTRRA